MKNQLINEIYRIKEMMGLKEDDELIDPLLPDESDAEEILPEITYTTAKHKPDFGWVFFNQCQGDLPTEGQVKLVNVRKPNSKGEREDDIIIDVNKLKLGKYGYYASDIEPEVKNVKSFDKITPKVTSSIGPNIINSKYKEVIFESLKSIYGGNSETWLNDGKRGPSGNGGVINIYTINEYLLNKNLIQNNGEGGEWSILNYFDTNPKVRESIMDMYQTETKKSINSTDELEEWCKWIYDNREKLFTEGVVLETLVGLNFKSFGNGYLNEDTAYTYVSNLISNNTNLVMSVLNLPGSSLDRRGVDFTVKNKSDKRQNHFQAKPLGELTVDGGKYIMTSYNVGGLENKPVQYFIFASHNKDKVIIFENIKGQVKGVKNIVEFNYPPISPEELIKKL